MAKPSVHAALEQVELTYSDIVEIADDMLFDILQPINTIMSDLNNNTANLTPEIIRDFIIRLQLRAYELSEIKERSSLKAQCAEALREEKHARSFNAADGSAAVKNNIALLESSEEVVVEALYNYVASLLKTKVDQLHRSVDALKSILMSKMQEAKLSMNGIE